MIAQMHAQFNYNSAMNIAQTIIVAFALLCIALGMVILAWLSTDMTEGERLLGLPAHYLDE